MRYVQFGKTELRVSELGLGCQSLGGGVFHRDDNESIAVLKKALDAGITLFDVSNHHSLGKSERLLGRTLRAQRNEAVITTKAGYDYRPMMRMALRARPLLRPIAPLLRSRKRDLHKARLAGGVFRFDGRHIIRAVDQSLRRLGLERIDLFQLYKPPAEVLAAGTIYETLDALQSAGKIRYYGIACLTVQDALTAMQEPRNASVQVAVNMLETAGVEELLTRARQSGIAVIARHPRAIGLLTRDHDDLMGDSSAYEHVQENRLEAARELNFLANDNRSLAQAAINYVREIPGVTVTLPRAVTVADLEENVGSLSAPPITREDRTRIEQVCRSLESHEPLRHGTG